MYTAAVITVSDRASRGEYEDVTGQVLVQMLKDAGYDVVETSLVPDERDQIEAELIRLSDQNIALILTTGGTGFAPRDVTPEATLTVIDRAAPGIAEAIRARSLAITPRAMLSRAVSGLRGKTLIINLPGSPKAVRESLEVVLPVLPHAVETLSGNTQNCGGNYGK